MATNEARSDAHLEIVTHYRVIHQFGGRTEIVLSLQSGEESKVKLGRKEAELVLGLLGKTRILKYDQVSQQLTVDAVEPEVDPGIFHLVAPSLDDWLGQHKKLRDSIIFETAEGPESYPHWPQWRKDALQTAFSAAWKFGSIQIIDPPPNIFHPGDNDAPTTVLSLLDACALYLASVGQSLAVEIGNRVSWSLLHYSAANLAIFLDSREFFLWSATHQGYEIQDVPGGDVVPASPHTMYTFLWDNDLVGAHRYGTIVRLLKWCHNNLSHFIGSRTAKTFHDVWRYRGLAPVSRTIDGTTDKANKFEGKRHWTAGCHGTAGFLRAILRTVNIPVVHDHQAGHALPYFSADGVHLSHGDDPYNGYTFADPSFAMAELLIDEAKYNSWFGSGVSDDTKDKNVGRRVEELAIEYLPTEMLRDYCNDRAAGKSRANGTVAANFSAYTVAQLKAQHLWSRMDTKISSLGGCDQLPYPY